MTTIDYPEHLSSVIFCRGCSFNCYYCHNPKLISRKRNDNICSSDNTEQYCWDEILKFLKSRVNLIEAVVFSGGEPLLQKNIYQAMLSIKDLGFKIGIHTAGIYPNRLKKILSLLDWVGMDVKAPFDDYESITQVPNSGVKPLESAKILLNSNLNIELEFRTTVHEKLLNNNQINNIKESLKLLNINFKKYSYVVQTFRAEGCENEYLL